jgi:hypothetical protein
MRRCCAARSKRSCPTHDVYITDWADARMVPLTAGRFDLDDYIDYVIEICAVLERQRACRSASASLRCRCSRRWRSWKRGDPFAPAVDDADGRPDRHAFQSDRGE